MKILFLLSAICCFSNLSIAQNNQLNWLEGTWKGKGLTNPYSGPGLKDFILKYESKTQELTMIFGGEEFSFNFLQANKGSFDISISKIRVFMPGVTNMTAKT